MVCININISKMKWCIHLFFVNLAFLEIWLNCRTLHIIFYLVFKFVWLVFSDLFKFINMQLIINFHTFILSKFFEIIIKTNYFCYSLDSFKIIELSIYFIVYTTFMHQISQYFHYRQPLINQHFILDSWLCT